MNTQYLKYALEVEKTGSITRAARNLFMAQPNLSKAIKDLEEDAGYEIFHRTASGMAATEKGKKYLQYADHIVKQLEEMDKIAGEDALDQITFKVSIPRGSYIANGIAQFTSKMEEKKEIDITVHETNSMKTIDNVVNRYYNLGIIRYQTIYEEYFMRYLKNNHLQYEGIWEFEFVLVMSVQHPLAKQQTILLEDLKPYIEIAHGDTDIPYLDRKNALILEEKRDKVIYVYERGSQFDLLENVPVTYMWVSPIPESYLERYNLTQRVCSRKDNRYKDVLIYREDYVLSEKDKIFQQSLYNSKIEVSSQKFE